MNYITINQIRKFIILPLVIFLSNIAYSQYSALETFQYISPIPGSRLILPENNIIIRHGEIIDESTIHRSDKIEVNGSLSGKHSGEFFLSTDLKTLIFKPNIPFSLEEEVTVKLSSGIMTIDGKLLLPIEFSFTICQKVIFDYQSELIEESSSIELNEKNNAIHNGSKFETLTNSESEVEGFPTIITIVSDNTAPGYIFLALQHEAFFSEYGYLMIVDNSGIPIYYTKSMLQKRDFKVQHNGLLTYWDFNSHKFFEMDSSYAIIDSFACGNGYNTDFHDFHLFPSGHSLLLGYIWQNERMDTVVAGGDSTARVLNFVIQELDANKNVIFQWRTWDYLRVTDATEDIDLTQHSIDPYHCNAVEIDTDGNLLLSSRNMDEVTKIDKQTGEIIWRWGGIKSRNNEFQFIDDPITFSHQHDIRRLPEGTLMMFDNGNLHSPNFSRSLEYLLDEENKLANLVWKYERNPPISARWMGSSRRLSNHNTLIGWGGLSLVSEVEADGSIVFELQLPDNFINYRVYRSPWRTNYFVTNPDSISFETVPVGDSSSIYVSIESNSSESIFITGFYNEQSSFIVDHPLPFNILPYGSEQIEIKFKPNEDGHFADVLHIRSDTDSRRIAQIINLEGSTGIEPVNEIINTFFLEQNYPNPFNPTTAIKYQIPENAFVIMKLYDAIGNEVSILVNEQKLAGSYTVELNSESLSSGIYFYRLSASNLSDVKKMILIK